MTVIIGNPLNEDNIIMHKFLITRFALIMLVILTVNCVSTREESAAKQEQTATDSIADKSIARLSAAATADTDNEQSAIIPYVRIYRTSGDFADNVPVGLSGDRSYLVSFPSVKDVLPESTPIPLADGYLLDRRGIRPTTAFTTYTYAQYAALEKTPQPAKLLSSVIPGSRVTEIVEMPFHVGTDLAADTAKCNRLIRNGLKGCKVIYK